MITVDEKNLTSVGDNIKVAKVEGKLVVVIDLGEEIGLSSTGKMMGIASSGGFTQIPVDGFKIKMNLYLGKKP
jgi:hypothetical protein